MGLRVLMPSIVAYRFLTFAALQYLLEPVYWCPHCLSTFNSATITPKVSHVLLITPSFTVNRCPSTHGNNEIATTTMTSTPHQSQSMKSSTFVSSNFMIAQKLMPKFCAEGEELRYIFQQTQAKLCLLIDTQITNFLSNDLVMKII